MKQILQGLNEVPGVLGSMVMTEDGMVVCSALSSSFDGEVVAAFASNARLCIGKAAVQCGDGIPHEMVLEGEEGSLILLDIEDATLVVITHAGLELNTGMLEIRSLARKLRGILEIQTS
ncbi:MAG: roadblock/LC7 domain-containing protein [Planctomycetia bacterium]|nr:roadblock/LC7 domain-containing protein [Planctomycetia bacterium]MBL6915360.1 roadblock/LC7 domain-containing protein [Planctomycetota bacterium]HCW44911.1 hypothetical protein [Planctomycetota bacterium]